MPDQDESLLGALAVERGWLEQDQLDEALANQRKMRDEMGIKQSVAQILLGKDLLSKDQVKKLSRAVARETGEVRVVGGYEVVARLGQGGMGAVYKAKKLDTGELVALKVLPPSLATEKLVARFKREAEITSRLESEHIVGCVEFGFDEKRKCHFCALEFIEGEDLGARITRVGKLPEDEAIAIARAIAEALQHAHLNGLVHRDVKPANIMVTPEGKAKLLDLGLARPASQQDVRLTQSGTFVGSAYYASPEQARGQGDIDTRSDVYSLAATLYHMVTGSPPFEGEAMMTVLQNQIGETVPWPAEVTPELSQGVCAIIAKGMAKDPGERYETPGDLAADLDLLTEGTEPGALAAPPRKSTVARRPRAKVRPAPSARRPAAKRAGAGVPRRARDYTAARGRGSKMPYAIAGGVLLALAALGIIVARGPAKKPKERPRPLPTVAVVPEPVVAPPTPPVAEPAPPVVEPTPPAVEGEPPEPSEQLVPELVPPAPRPITMPVPLAPPPAGAAFDLARGLVGHWKFDETEGAVARDSSDKGNDGTVKGGAKWAEGRIGGALEFDGVDDWVITGSKGLNPHAGTVAAWVKYEGGTGYQYVFSHKVAGMRSGTRVYLNGCNGAYGVGIGDKGKAFMGGRLTSAWSHLAVTWDRGTFATYRDGSGMAVGRYRDFSGTDRLCAIGSYRDTRKDYWRGLIDDVRIYDRALSIEEVKALFEGRAATEPRTVRAVWNSWDVTVTGGEPPATVTDTVGGVKASVDLYISIDAGGVRRGGPFPAFTRGRHGADFNRLESFVSVQAGNGYPYAGKSTVARGTDAEETNAPAPTGVKDMMVHPPSNDSLVVAAFVAPEAGTYTVSGLAARRINPQGESIRYSAFDPDRRRIASVRAVNNRRWVSDPGTYDIGELAAGDRIYFGVDRDGDWNSDATEIAWTVTMTGGTPEPEKPTRLLVDLDAFLMKGDHAGALAWAEEASRADKCAEVKKEIASVEGVCRAIESRSKAALAAAQARVGRKVELAGRLGRPRKGEVKAVTEKGIDLVTKFVIVAGGKRHEREKRVTVAWRELALDQVDELAREGGWKPAVADAAVARAYLALGRRKSKAAMKALERAGDHPLAEHILALIEEPSTPAEAARAKRAAPPSTLTLDLGRGVTMEMIYIKPGVFVMGGTEDIDPNHQWWGVQKPKHEVAITKGFYIGKYEVTQSQYEALMGANPSNWKGPNRPVEQVTWHDSVRFCRLAAERTGRRCRLPTEAEWEYACRAGSTGRYCSGSDEAGLGDYAWYDKNSGGQTHPVGQKKANAWGVYDTHGNVWEWVADWYAPDYYANSPRQDPTGPETGKRRLLRGGSWNGNGNTCRSAFRNPCTPSSRPSDHGFRIVVSSVPGPTALSPRAKAIYERSMSRAKIRVRLKNWEGAVESLEEALKAKPGDAEAERLLAEAKLHTAPEPTLTLDLGRGVTMEMIYVKPGVFTMGGTVDANPNSSFQGIEKPKHEVAITRGFYIGKYEVTQAQYEAVTGSNPSARKAPDLPVEQVTWHQAAEFCRLATERTRRKFRLSTEAEWEYACRAGSTGPHGFDSDKAGLGEYAWHRGNAGGRAHPVGGKKPNAWGIHDMHGNVWEWVADWYAADYYTRSPREDPAGPDTGKLRVFRGGSWYPDIGLHCRSAFRHHASPSFRYPTLGFRAVVSVAPVQRR